MEALHARYAPFARRDAYGPMACSISRAEKLRIALFWCTGVPLVRAAVCLALLASFSVVCQLFRAAPARLRHAALPWLAWLHVRGVLFCCGFLWIARCRLGPPRSAGAPPPVCIVSNHVSWADILVHMGQSFPSFVAKAAIRKLPLVGVISASMECIFVERERAGAGGAGALVQERLRARAADPWGGPPLLLFPEGTTQNGDFLLPFKTGAFLTGAPVQPVLLRYRWRRFSPAYEVRRRGRGCVQVHDFADPSAACADHHRAAPPPAHLQPVLPVARGTGQHAPCACATQLTAFPLQGVYLPMYEPSAAERKDPALYAAGVRAAMLRTGSLTASELTLEDKRAYQQALLASAVAPADAKSKTT